MPRVFTIDGAGTHAHVVPYLSQAPTGPSVESGQSEGEAIVRLRNVERGQVILKVVLAAVATLVAVDIGLTLWSR